MATWLKPHGVFYCSFKLGDKEITRGERRFTDMNPERLQGALKGTGLVVKSTWVTGDLRKGRALEKWINAILIFEGT